MQQTQFSSPLTALQLIEQKLGALAPNQVRIKMAMANINPSDLLSIQGVGQYQHYHKPPRVPGFEGVGYVVESNNHAVKVGEKVVVAHSGTWQKYVDLEPNDCFVIPHTIPEQYASQLYINALTAWAIVQQLQINKNNVVLINAGSSAIGKIFSQFAQALGFKLITVTSRPEYCHKTTQYIIDSNKNIAQQMKAKSIPKPDIILDAIGGKAAEELADLLKDDGQFLVYGSLALTPFSRDFYAKMKKKSIHFQYFFLRDWEKKVGKDQRNIEFYAMLTHFIQHNIELNSEYLVPITDYQTAFRLLEKQDLKGKILFTF
ncbi:hypothetical protein A6A21_00415 [Phocoenobacter uteri]|nr:hypothetical protein [Phocoenobacter uteri]